MCIRDSYDFLAAQTDESKYAMVGYRLKNTVTEFGSVARGVCEIEDGMLTLSLIHISEPTRLGMISYAVFCLKKKKKTKS